MADLKNLITNLQEVITGLHKASALAAETLKKVNAAQTQYLASYKSKEAQTEAATEKIIQDMDYQTLKTINDLSRT